MKPIEDIASSSPRTSSEPDHCTPFDSEIEAKARSAIETEDPTPRRRKLKPRSALPQPFVPFKKRVVEVRVPKR